MQKIRKTQCVKQLLKKLPLDILGHILCFLEPREIVKFKLVSKYFASLISSHYLPWSYLLRSCLEETFSLFLNTNYSSNIFTIKNLPLKLRWLKKFSELKKEIKMKKKIESSVEIKKILKANLNLRHEIKTILDMFNFPDFINDLISIPEQKIMLIALENCVSCLIEYNYLDIQIAYSIRKLCAQYKNIIEENNFTFDEFWDVINEKPIEKVQELYGLLFHFWKDNVITIEPHNMQITIYLKRLSSDILEEAFKKCLEIATNFSLELAESHFIKLFCIFYEYDRFKISVVELKRDIKNGQMCWIKNQPYDIDIPQNEREAYFESFARKNIHIVDLQIFYHCSTLESYPYHQFTINEDFRFLSYIDKLNLDPFCLNQNIFDQISQHLKKVSDLKIYLCKYLPRKNLYDRKKTYQFLGAKMMRNVLLKKRELISTNQLLTEPDAELEKKEHIKVDSAIEIEKRLRILKDKIANFTEVHIYPPIEYFVTFLPPLYKNYINYKNKKKSSLVDNIDGGYNFFAKIKQLTIHQKGLTLSLIGKLTKLLTKDANLVKLKFLNDFSITEYPNSNIQVLKKKKCINMLGKIKNLQTLCIGGLINNNFFEIVRNVLQEGIALEIVGDMRITKCKYVSFFKTKLEKFNEEKSKIKIPENAFVDRPPIIVDDSKIVLPINMLDGGALQMKLNRQFRAAIKKFNADITSSTHAL